jgi:REP element-mobilizing transposase RayT
MEGVILSVDAKDTIFACIKFHADKKYKLYACVIMGTHVHCIIQPLEQQEHKYYSIAQIMHSIKSYSAKRIMKLKNSKGSVWLDESYDRIIRDGKEFLDTMNYIVCNPVKVGLVRNPADYKWLFYQGSV